MDWSEVTIQVPVEHVDAAAAIAQMAVPYGIYIEDYSDMITEVPKIAHIDLIDEELLAKDRANALVHIYIKPTENPAEAVSFLTEHLTDSNIPFKISTLHVKEEDWATAWKKYYHPIAVGKKLVICPTWEECELHPGQTKLSLDPGMAFGTGTHDTTRLCMQLLEDYVTPTSAVLDMGCGSGILSIAAMLLGGAMAVGVDIDDTAVRVAKENAQLNHVEGRTQFFCGDLTEKVCGTFDILCANIVADVIMRLSPAIPQYLKKEGIFLASGIIDLRCDEVIEALKAVGLHVIRREESGGWVALACKF